MFDDGADAEQLAELVGYLRVELLQLDVDDVVDLREGQLPPGTRGNSAATVGSLLITIGQSADGLRQVIAAVRDWLRRGGSAGRMIRIELDGDALELRQATVAQQERLVELFASRHSADGGSP